jgi:hypothetical protein
MSAIVSGTSSITRNGSVELHALARLPDGLYKVPISRDDDNSYRRADNTYVSRTSSESGFVTVRKRGDEIFAMAYAGGVGAPDAPVVFGFKPEMTPSGGNVMWMPVSASGEALGAVYGRASYRDDRSEIYGSTYGIWLKLVGNRLEASFSYFGKTPNARSGYPWAPAFKGSVGVRLG